MEWRDRAIILHAERYGEGDAILELMTCEHGRHRGYVKGGMSRRRRADLQPGNEVEATWNARLHSQLGRFTVEIVRARVADLLQFPDRLTAFNAAAAVLLRTLPEREEYGGIFDGLVAFLDLLAAVPDDKSAISQIGSGLVRLEVGVLGALGFGLDLEKCAATGQADDLVYVSPRTGRAVSAEAGAPYRERMLPLPAFLTTNAVPDNIEALAGLQLTGHFLEHHVLAHGDRQMPKARERFVGMLRG